MRGVTSIRVVQELHRDIAVDLFRVGYACSTPFDNVSQRIGTSTAGKFREVLDENRGGILVGLDKTVAKVFRGSFVETLGHALENEHGSSLLCGCVHPFAKVSVKGGKNECGQLFGNLVLKSSNVKCLAQEVKRPSLNHGETFDSLKRLSAANQANELIAWLAISAL